MDQLFSYNFLKEVTERQNRFTKIKEVYTPNMKATTTSRKFYSKYDALVAPSEQSTLEKYMKFVEKAMEDGPREKYKEPMLESHNYGWIPEPFFIYDENDKKLFHRIRTRTSITKLGEKLAMDKVTRRAAFNGAPFKLR